MARFMQFVTALFKMHFSFNILMCERLLKSFTLSYHIQSEIVKIFVKLKWNYCVSNFFIITLLKNNSFLIISENIVVILLLFDK